MMLSWQAATALFVLIAAILGRIVGGSPRNHPGGFGKYLVGDRFGLTSAITLGALLAMASLGIGVGRVYVVNSPKDWSVNWAFGSPSFKLANGKSIRIRPHAVVNNSAEQLVLESVAYGNGEQRDNVVVPAADSASFDHGVIHYFFDEQPPKSVKSKTGQATQWWLRRL